MAGPDPIADLTSTLERLNPTLAQLCDALIEQRRTLGAGDLDALLDLTARQEELTARLELLERRRLAIQGGLEGDLGVTGLREIARCAVTTDAQRERLIGLIDEVGRTVTQLHEENERSATLLNSAVGMAQRMRSRLGRATGAETSYAPPSSRRPTRSNPGRGRRA